MIDLVDVLRLVAVPLLVGMNGFFVAAEFALVTVRWTRVEEMVEQGRFGAIAVRDAVEKLDDAIAATQLGITFASLALGWVGEPALAHIIEPWFESLPVPWATAASHAIAVGIAFMLITFLHVVLGELAPKAIALQRAEDVSLVVAGPLNVFGRVFRPFIHFMNSCGNWVVRQLRLPPLSKSHGVHSVEELTMLVEETQEAGVLPEEEATFVRNVFELSDTTVRDVMVPREKVVTIPIHASEDEVLAVARDTAHTRMPVWEGTPDHIVGIVNTKDLFHLFSLRGLVILMDAVYPPVFVGPEQRVADLLRTFKREKRQMAVVCESGGVFAGIVTLEDILEEIVGEIEDEHDFPRPPRLDPTRRPYARPAPAEPPRPTGAEPPRPAMEPRPPGAR
jgi:putative hemolysin